MDAFALRFAQNIISDCLTSVLPIDHDNVRSDDNSLPEPAPFKALSQSWIAAGLSRLGLTADGLHQAMLELSVEGTNATDISPVARFTQLQIVKLSKNAIADMSPLDCLEHVLELDISHNHVSQLSLSRKSVLRKLNISHNYIHNISAVQCCPSLTEINLAHNRIANISPLIACKHLSRITASYNRISKLPAMDALQILRTLLLDHNRIQSLTYLSTASALTQLDISHNRVSDLREIGTLRHLETFLCQGNQLTELAQLRHLNDLQWLRSIDFRGNKVVNEADFRLATIYRLGGLLVCDGQEVTLEERIDAINLCDPPLPVLAAMDHAKRMGMRLQTPTRVEASTLVGLREGHPMLVVASNDRTKCATYLHQALQKHADGASFDVVPTHRVGKSADDEQDDTDAFHIMVDLEHFVRMSKAGAFIAGDAGVVSDSVEALASALVEQVCAKPCIPAVVASLPLLSSLRRSSFDVRCVYLIFDTSRRDDVLPDDQKDLFDDVIDVRRNSSEFDQVLSETKEEWRECELLSHRQEAA
eukprot:TRINITY_DN10408_c0_g1_i8.p1 TRINITY_DN10408_c0_g1~~TRINITY_DN10408_c0_g1_i8.p1  ORF type:complete len:551 (+),score=76.07 TRINITY_DN10408_c0_g1_i8:57-1655(+)